MEVFQSFQPRVVISSEKKFSAAHKLSCANWNLQLIQRQTGEMRSKNTASVPFWTSSATVGLNIGRYLQKLLWTEDIFVALQCDVTKQQKDRKFNLKTQNTRTIRMFCWNDENLRRCSGLCKLYRVCGDAIRIAFIVLPCTAKGTACLQLLKQLFNQLEWGKDLRTNGCHSQDHVEGSRGSCQAQHETALSHCNGGKKKAPVSCIDS